MQDWISLPKKKKARQWHTGDKFPGIYHDEAGGKAYVITIHGQKAYLADGDFVVEEPGGQYHYPCKADIWLSSHQLCES